MKAVIAKKGGAKLVDVPQPEAGAGQLLARVHAAALNRADLGTLKLARDEIIGMEWAGEVVQTGTEVQGFKPGDRVMCSGKGAFAEFAVTDWGRAAIIPDPAMDFEQAASMMLALQTMHNAVVTHGKVEKDDVVLIHGAASGVGLMAAQIARQKGARTVVGTSRSAGRRLLLEAHGFDLVLDSADPQWTDQVLAFTAGNGVNVIIDQVSGSHFNQLLKIGAIHSRIVNVGRLGGSTGSFDFETHALKRITYTGVTFRTRTAEEVRDITARMLDDLRGALEAGEFHMPLDEIFPLAKAPQALDRMAANEHFGKIILSMQQC